MTFGDIWWFPQVCIQIQAESPGIWIFANLCGPISLRPQQLRWDIDHPREVVGG